MPHVARDRVSQWTNRDGEGRQLLKRVVCEIMIECRRFTLVVDESQGERKYAWYEGRMFSQQVTALESAMGGLIEQLQGDIARMRCMAWGIRDCCTCGNAICLAQKSGVRCVSHQPQHKESTSMPSKKDLKAAKKAGVNPYAVAQDAVNNRRIKPSQKEDVVKGVTKSALARKRGRKKGK